MQPQPWNWTSAGCASPSAVIGALRREQYPRRVSQHSFRLLELLNSSSVVLVSDQAGWLGRVGKDTTMRRALLLLTLFVIGARADVRCSSPAP
jgi:hypothetical protein